MGRVTDKERREVARRLREIRPCKSGHIEWWTIAKALDLKESAGWFGWEKFEPDSANRLADLIEPEPERTCHDTDYSRESITCSECGEITMNTLYFVDLDGGYRTVKSHRPRFCSNCGARVIGEEAGDAD